MGSLCKWRGPVRPPVAPEEAKLSLACKVFVGFSCGNCGMRKKKGYAFCLDCYAALPPELQRGLWKRFGEGFEEAFAAARKWLRGGEEE